MSGPIASLVIARQVRSASPCVCVCGGGPSSPAVVRRAALTEGGFELRWIVECPAVDGEDQTCLTRYDAHIRSSRMVRSSAIVRASSDGLARAMSMRWATPEICGAVSQRPSKSGYRYSSVAHPNSLSQQIGQARRTSANGGEHAWTAEGRISGGRRPETETGIETGRLDV